MSRRHRADAKSPSLPLANLPFEIRNQIYRHAIPTLTATWLNYNCGVPAPQPLDASNLGNSVFTLHGDRKTFPYFIHTDRQILHEARPLLMESIILHFDWQHSPDPDRRLWRIKKKDLGLEGNITFSLQDLSRVRAAYAYLTNSTISTVRRAVEMFLPGLRWLYVRQGWYHVHAPMAGAQIATTTTTTPTGTDSITSLDPNRYPTRDAISDADVTEIATDRLDAFHTRFNHMLGAPLIMSAVAGETQIGEGDTKYSGMQDFEALLSHASPSNHQNHQDRNHSQPRQPRPNQQGRQLHCIMELEMLFDDQTQNRLGMNHLEVTYEWGGSVLEARLVDGQYSGCRWPEWHDPNHHGLPDRLF